MVVLQCSAPGERSPNVVLIFTDDQGYQDLGSFGSRTIKTPHQAFFYHRRDELTAVRGGPWKLHTKAGRPVSLFTLESEMGESKNVLKPNPQVVKRLLKRMADFSEDIAKNSRPADFVDDPKPLELGAIKFSNRND
ncbi:MAG: hypothetical protein ACI87E_005211 [Mariniblastus sp.]